MKRATTMKSHAERSSEFDVSLTSDLLWCVANLVEAEEHLAFSIAQLEEKVGKKKIEQLENALKELTAVRAKYLGTLGKELGIEFGSEKWCALKHLLESILRSQEVGQKYMRKGSEQKALFFSGTKKLLEILFLLRT